ncbi:MAG: DNA internalization-related competence protein ComEC/Rec2 [Vicinamibacterales bacterium]
MAPPLHRATAMQVVLAIPVSGLLAGAALGLHRPDVPPLYLVAVLCGWLLLALHGLRVAQPVLVGVATCGAFAVGGATLSADAWHRAWRPPLMDLFERTAAATRADDEVGGRDVPLDDRALVVLTGVLRTDASLTASGTVSLALDVERVASLSGGKVPAGDVDVEAPGGALLTVLGEMAASRVPEWRAGRRIRAPADLRRAARYLNPGVADQERSLARRGVRLVGIVKSGALVEMVQRGSALQEWAASARSYSRQAIRQAVADRSERAAGIVTAIVIGDRTGLDDGVERRLQEAGTYHVIAISGGNIAILAGLTLVAFRVLGMLGRLAMLSAAAGLVAYGFLVGGGASVERAVLMAVVYFVGRGWDLRGPPFQALVLAAGVLVLADPLSVGDAGMLLTFGATAAIVAAGQVTGPVRANRWLAPVVSMFMASAAAEAALLPVAVTWFSRVTLAGLVLNFAAIPLMAVAQLAGMVIIPLHAAWPMGARAAGWLAWVGAEGLVRTADLVALAPWTTWRVPAASVWATAFYYAALVLAWWGWRLRLRPRLVPETLTTRWLRMGATAAAMAGGGWIALAPPVPWRTHGDGQLHVTFIDVGQGDAALIRFPRGQAMLIDTGGLPGSGSFDLGERVVAPVLRHLGVRHLSALVLTHGDSDHIGGALSVMAEFRPWDLWEGIPVPPLAALARIDAAATDAGIRRTTVQPRDRMVVDDVEVRVLHPGQADWERQAVRNDDSIVVELRWRDVSFVFTGDIGRVPEAEIAASVEPVPLRVLKVPHHGSLSSSSAAFLRALRPDVAVVSVGRGNNFGHPSPVVLRRYEEIGTRLFRTDRDGAVSIDTDGTTLRVSTFAGSGAPTKVNQRRRM